MKEDHCFLCLLKTQALATYPTLLKMPRPLTASEIRLKNVIACLDPVIILLNELDVAFGTPFMKALSNTTLSLVAGLQVLSKSMKLS